MEAATAINKRIHLIAGGYSLLPAPNEEIQRVASALHDTWRVEWIAPVHCTGEPALAILQKTFADHYIYAGLGSSVGLGANPLAEAAEDRAGVFCDRADAQTYRRLSVLEGSHDHVGVLAERHD